MIAVGKEKETSQKDLWFPLEQKVLQWKGVMPLLSQWSQETILLMRTYFNDAFLELTKSKLRQCFQF